MPAKIPLVNGGYVVVSDHRFDDLSRFKWYKRSGYAYLLIDVAGSRIITDLSMHRLITKCPSGMVVDHINRDKLDNRDENLRVVTQRENTWNRGKRKTKTTSRYIGVHRIGRKRRFHAHIGWNRKQISLGVYASEVEAAYAYDVASALLRKDMAPTAQVDPAEIDPNAREQIEQAVKEKLEGTWRRHNQTGFTGVWHTFGKPSASIWDGRKLRNLGQFASDIEAAFAYNVAFSLLRSGNGPNSIPEGALTPERETAIVELVQTKLKPCADENQACI